MHYHFEWDPQKAAMNISGHRISFSRAAAVFKDAGMLTIFDEGHSEREERWLTLGHDEHGILLVVSHLFQSIEDNHCLIRIISARKATRRERRQYGAEP
ncbi:MAG: BrnT family toxin [bacterium]|nr:BrnT family toxin [bacterium]